MLAARSCCPSTPRPGVPGCPYSATRRRPGNRTCPPPGSWRPVSATAILLARRAAGPNCAPTATTAAGRSRASAVIAAGSARGSVPVTSTTAAPAACAVAVTAAIDALDVLLPTWRWRRGDQDGHVAERRRGAASRAAPRPCRPPSRRAAAPPAAAGQAAGRPSVSTATGCSARAEAASWARAGLAAVVAVARASSTRRVRGAGVRPGCLERLARGARHHHDGGAGEQRARERRA